MHMSANAVAALLSCVSHVIMQVDNPQRDAIFPVGFLSPAPVASLGLSMLPEAALPSSSATKAPALCGRVAVWQRTPAGVRCFERIEVGHQTGSHDVLNQATEPCRTL